MKIELKEITVADLFEGYKDNEESGVAVIVVNLMLDHLIKESLFTKISKEMQ